MQKALELTRAMNARLCHDLAGTIGTIDNCLGLIDNGNKEIAQKAKDLVVDESNNLVNKIKFFRGAYGVSDGALDISLVSLRKTLSDLLKNKELELKLSFEEGILMLEAELARAVMCLMTVAYEKIASHGKIELKISTDNLVPIKICSEGKNVNIKDENIEILEGKKAAPVNVANCREHYINKLCASKGYKLSVKKKGNSVEYNIIKS